MTRTVPGTGASIKPIFDENFGVSAVRVLDGGSGYDLANPPRLTISGCGTPDQEALLYPIIDADSGQIIHVRVLERGRGYDPLRLQFFPEQETPNVINSFDVNRIWQDHPNSLISGTFSADTDRLRIQSDNHPKPTYIQEEAAPGGGPLIDRSFDQTFIYRGGKDVPHPTVRTEQDNKVLGIFANGGLLHTPEWGSTGNAPTNFAIDSVKYDYVKSNSVYDTVTEGNVRYYHSNKTLDEFKLGNGVFEWGKIKQFTWNVKVETGNVSLDVTNVDETLGTVVVGRTIDEIGGNASGEISKVVRNNLNVVTRIYLRQLTGSSFSKNDLCLGSTGFSFKISEDPYTFNGYYIDFGADAAKFGTFTPGTFYFAPENITVKQNYLIKFNQSDSTNNTHPIRFSTTADGTHNDTPGTLYYTSTGASSDPAADYENEYAPIFIMNADETNRIYYYCKNHPNMAGSSGDEGYMIISTDTSAEILTNNYYVENYYGSGGTLDYSRRSDGHSKILGMSYDGYPIYGPYGYLLGGTSVLTVSGYGGNNGIGYGENDSPLSTTNVVGSGSGLKVKCTSTGSSGSGQTFEVVEQGSGYAVGDRFKIIHENPNGIFSYGYTSGQNDASRTPGTYNVDITTAMTSGNGNSARAQVVVAVGGNTDVTFPYTNEDWTGRGRDFAESETITIPNSLVGGGADIVLNVQDLIDDGWQAINEVTTVGDGIGRQVSSHRLRTTAELPGARPAVNTTGTTTYNVTVSNGEFLFGGSRPNFLSLGRGKTFIFNQDDASNNGEFLLFSETDGGWHPSSSIGTTSYLYELGVTYTLDGSTVTYAAYIAGFNAATQRRIQIVVPATAPDALYIFGYQTSGLGLRTVQSGYILGDLVQDYIYDSSVGTLDEFNGKFAVTPDYPNGTYAYFMTEDSSGNPVYPYVIGRKFYGTPLFEGNSVPEVLSDFPDGAAGEVVLNDSGQIAYVKMTKNGDNYYNTTKARILGGEGSGATGTSTVQTVTGLTLLNSGRSYSSAPTVVFEGGGGQDAQGSAKINTTGKVTSIAIADPGEFYQEPPYVLLTGGSGIGAKAVATIDQGQITSITVTDQGEGYTTPPNVIFTRLVNLKRKTRARQAYNAKNIYLTGLTKDVTTSASEIYVKDTGAFPGSGEFILDYETISYTSKTDEKFAGITRGVNFNYDQRVILDDGQNDDSGISTYKFNIGDRVIRRVESASNKVAKVYDWNASTRELLLTFEIDELAFIDGGIPSSEEATVQFDAGVAGSAGALDSPHVVLTVLGSTIITLTNPISTLQDKEFQDILENEGAGDGIPDLVNTSTEYENQISLDGGIYSSLYGIEETQGGTNTTLLQVGDSVKDANVPFRYANIAIAGGLSEGREHNALVNITLDALDGNGQNFSVNEIVTGDTSGVRGTVVSWDLSNKVLQLKDVTAFNTGDVNVGEAGYLYKFAENSTIVDVVIQNAGTNYSAIPTVAFESIGDIQATGTVTMTVAGDQVAGITITNGGYGYVQSIDNSYNLHPTITFTNAGGDTTGSGAVGYAIMGGEKVSGNNGAQYRIKSIEYLSTVRSK